MVEQEKPKKSVVKTTSIVAAGMASVVAALFTSRLGVAGTLVGAGMTSMIITLTSAVLNAQLEKASSAARGRLLERLRSIPGYLKGLSPTARRGILLSGILAGVVATAIALSAITFTEAVAGEDLSSLVWSQGVTASGTSIGRFFNDATSAGNQDQQYVSPGGDQQYQEPAQQPGSGQPQLGEDPAQQPVPPSEDPARQPIPEQPAAPPPGQ